MEKEQIVKQNKITIGDVTIQSDEPLSEVMKTIKNVFKIKKQQPLINIINKRGDPPYYNEEFE